MEGIKEFLITTFQNYTPEMYEGNIPAGKGHQRINGGYFDRWATKYGGGESYKDIVSFASFSISRKITIYITGEHLWIVDIRYSGKPDFWEYTNIEGRGMPGPPCCSEKSRHKLEPENIEKILNTKIDNCKFWNIVQKKARKLYIQGAIKQCVG